MKTIILKDSEGRSQTSVKIGVTNKDFKTIKSLEYIGGFKRFGLSLYDDKAEAKKSERNKIIDFMELIFANNNLIATYF